MSIKYNDQSEKVRSTSYWFALFAKYKQSIKETEKNVEYNNSIHIKQTRGGENLDLRMGIFDVLLVATFLMLFISYLSYRKRKQDVAKYCALVMLAASFYSFGYAFEIISTNLDQAKFWLKVQYVGIPFITTFWLILVIIYTGHQGLLKRWVMPLLFAIPFLTLILHYTNDIHYLFYRDILFEPSSSNLSATLLFKGPWYWVHISYLYLEAAFGMLLFVRMYSKAIPIVRKQVVMLILGAAAPWLANIIYLTAYSQMNFDLTPIGFTLSGLIYVWGIYRFNLLRLVPVAYQKVFETMQDGVIILDYDHNLSHVNKAARSIFEELNSWNGQTISVDEIFASNPDLLKMISDLEHNENRISIQKGEEMRYYHVKMSVIYDKSGMVLGKLIIFSDVTQVTLYQEQLVANANQLEELNAFKDKLFAVVTHDIRDPLALLVNLTEIIEEDFIDSGSEESRIFREISSQVRDTHLLVDNLLDWVRSQRGKINFRPLVWELEPIVSQSIKAMRNRLNIKHIDMTVSVQDGSKAYADKEMVELILRNLMFNAIKYTEVGGHIHIEVVRNTDRVTVSVKDSGVGVDSEVGKSLFHEMQQGSLQGTDGERGTGLGLYLCGKFVRLNGGDIWYETKEGQGSTFYFTLPSTKASDVRDRTWKEVDAI
jgi:signal transduction histidine kinase